MRRKGRRPLNRTSTIADVENAYCGVTQAQPTHACCCGGTLSCSLPFVLSVRTRPLICVFRSNPRRMTHLSKRGRESRSSTRPHFVYLRSLLRSGTQHEQRPNILREASSGARDVIRQFGAANAANHAVRIPCPGPLLLAGLFRTGPGHTLRINLRKLHSPALRSLRVRARVGLGLHPRSQSRSVPLPPRVGGRQRERG